MSEKWNKTPKHILRFNALKDLVKDFKVGSFIEFGAGTGDFTKYFLEKKFKGFVYDIDPKTLESLENNLKSYANASVIPSLETIKNLQFDYIFAFEVLEHIEDDKEVLIKWSSFLKNNGTILLSMPAHQSKYSKEDKRVGHCRRYERNKLIKLLEDSGFIDITLINYGFPLGNITRITKNFINIFKFRVTNKTDIENSIKSGIERDTIERKFKFLFNEKLLLPFILLQRLFFKFDLGDGYIVYARKKSL